MRDIEKCIAITYVPNSFCNFGCKYCYLGSLTDNLDDNKDVVSKLKIILSKLKEEGIVVHKVHLHGAEVSTLPKKVLKELFGYILKYREENYFDIKRLWGKQSEPIHIKTNLYNFDKLMGIYGDHKVTVSGSFDLPYSMHSELRPTKGGKDTLPRILKNIELLKDYKRGKVLSCVVTKAHLLRFDEFVRDLRHLHEVVGFNVIKNFYIMFGYDSNAAVDKFGEKIEGTEMLAQDEMALFYKKMKEEFSGTDYEEAIYYSWFREFQPGYCTFAKNCGEEMFLFQKNGDVYPCHRTQPRDDFKFGNIFKQSFKDIRKNSIEVIKTQENTVSISEDCLKCNYFQYCKMNCTLIRAEANMAKSYTCSLQLEMYKDDPKRFPPMTDKDRDWMVRDFVRDNNVVVEPFLPEKTSDFITNELFHKDNSLSSIISKDNTLHQMFNKDNFKLRVGGNEIQLSSQLLGGESIHILSESEKVELMIEENVFNIHCKDRDLADNNLYIMMLKNSNVSYGDEGRTKQEHIWHQELYRNNVLRKSKKDGRHFVLDITDIVFQDKGEFETKVVNNLMFTTKQMRKYHYRKHRDNAFYHIQAINLPFHNLLFYFLPENRLRIELENSV